MKNYAYIALSVMALLFIGGIFTYQDRFFFGDPAYMCFKIIKFSSLQIQEHRYGAFITQMVPYLAYKLHLPLNIIVFLYSISFNLFYLIVASILVFRYKQFALAILMAFYYTLMVSDSYYWINNEVHQAVAWMFLLLGFLLHSADIKRHPMAVLLPFTILAFLSVYTHFIAIIPLCFLFVWLILDKKEWKYPIYLTVTFSVIIVALIVYKFTHVKEVSYDGSKLTGFSHFKFRDIANIVSQKVNIHFNRLCLSNYWWASLMFISGIAYMLYTKKLIQAIWVFLVIFGYILCLGLAFSYMETEMPLYYVETEWQCMSILFATPFVYYVLPKIQPKIATILLIVIFATRFVYIGGGYQKCVARTDFKRAVFAQMKKKGVTKLGLHWENKIMDNYPLHWTMAVETLMMSAMQNDKPQLSFLLVTQHDTTLLRFISDPKILAICECTRCYEMIKSNDLNHNYFNYDTLTPYTVMSYDDFMK